MCVGRAGIPTPAIHLADAQAARRGLRNRKHRIRHIKEGRSRAEIAAHAALHQHAGCGAGRTGHGHTGRAVVGEGAQYGISNAVVGRNQHVHIDAVGIGAVHRPGHVLGRTRRPGFTTVGGSYVERACIGHRDHHIVVGRAAPVGVVIAGRHAEIQGTSYARQLFPGRGIVVAGQYVAHLREYAVVVARRRAEPEQRLGSRVAIGRSRRCSSRSVELFPRESNGIRVGICAGSHKDERRLFWNGKVRLCIGRWSGVVAGSGG